MHAQLMQSQASDKRGRSEEMFSLMPSPISSLMAMDDMDTSRRKLFRLAMRGEWQKVLGIYRKDPRAYRVKITKSGDTALHVAVSDGQEAVVEEMVNIMNKKPEEVKEALKMENDNEKSTPLHLAASLGSVRMCRCIAEVDPTLVGARNRDNDTPLFLAALHGKKQAFLCLHQICRSEERRQYYTGNEGDTILHVAIRGEYLDLAFQIIHLDKNLVNRVNERGISPLHILAGKPTIFRSGSHLKGYSRIIYHCTFVAELKVEEQSDSHDYCAKVTKKITESPYPKNYETCIHLFGLVRKAIEVVIKPAKSCKEDAEKCFRGDAENQQGSKINEARDDQLIPSSYTTCFDILKFVSKAILVILGLGSSEIKKIRDKKEKHVWSAQIMKELLEQATLYEYEDSGRNPYHEQVDNYDDVGSEMTDGFETNQNNGTAGVGDQNNAEKSGKPETREMEEQGTARLMMVKNGVSDDIVEKILRWFPLGDVNLDRKNIALMAVDKPKVPEMPVVESPILIAAKNGITEMVEKILKKFPVAIHDKNTEKKNAVLLAVEHRQPHVYKLLLTINEGMDSDDTTVKDIVFRHVDDKGNSALHLAATLGDYKPWLIPGAALQMQWEMKWYEFVKHSVSRHFFVRHNKAGKTPKDIFTDTHQELVKNGAEWLTTTSESCSVVAALIATVAFATSSTVPGGVKEDDGTPILEHHPAFNVFAVSSLVALCFSVTSVIMFLAILTSRHQEKDFRGNLPGKLLLGLSSLFVSIAAILVSFCAGHFFVLKDQLRYAAFPVYAVTCLPVTLFAIAQFPLYLDLFWATFKKVPQRSYMVVPL